MHGMHMPFWTSNMHTQSNQAVAVNRQDLFLVLTPAVLHSVEEWSLGSAGQLQRKGRALKCMPLAPGLLPCREVASLRMLSGCGPFPALHASRLALTDSGCLESRLCLRYCFALLLHTLPLVV